MEGSESPQKKNPFSHECCVLAIARTRSEEVKSAIVFASAPALKPSHVHCFRIIKVSNNSLGVYL
jgi:hypothetical protein